MTPNLTNSLIDHLRGRIVDGEIAPGEKLPSENTLIAEHGVSRTVVREAIMRLQAEGLVHTRRGSGSFALTPPAAETSPLHPARQVRTVQDRRQLLEYRTAIESEAAALAAGRHTGSHLAILRSSVEAFGRAEGNPGEALKLDFDFHRTVAEASGNPYLADAIGALGPAMIAMPRRRLDASGGAAEDRLARVAAEHEAVLAAIESGDALGAAAAMRSHLANSKRRLDQESGRR